MDANTRKFVFAGIALAVVLAIGGTIHLATSDADDAQPADAQPEDSESWLQPWTAENATPLPISWSGSAGPTAALEGSNVDLSPAGMTWTSEKAGGSTIIRGESEDGTQVSWEFADGNPTAVLRVQRTVPITALGEPHAVTLTLPDGELEAWGALTGFHAVDTYQTKNSEPQWLRWTSGSASLTYRGWTGDSFEVEPNTGGGHEVRLGLWNPGEHPTVVECLGELESSDVRLDAQVLVEFRELPRLAAWPYPDAAQAMLLPIFLAPELHSDPQLGEAKSRNAKDFVDRVTTLAYGHSSAKDPRYGNGGLLGHGLGGTVVAPARLLGKNRVEKLANDLALTRVGIAAGGTVEKGAPYDIRFANEVSCKSLRSPELAGLVSPTPDDNSPALREAPSAFETQVFARVLDGRLDSLLAQGFSRAYAGQALRDGDVYAFASPLVATRNPLIGAAADALLEPERKGMWTVSPRLAGGLADVELWREEHPIGVSSVHDLVHYRSFSRDAALSWSESGAPHVATDTPRSQIGYTIAIDGEAKLPDSLDPPPRVRSVETKSGPVTLLSWDAAPDMSSLELARDLSATAVDWTITEQ